MGKEKITPEKLEEREPKEVARHELDSEKEIAIVLKSAPGIRLPETSSGTEIIEGKVVAFNLESASVVLEQKGKDDLDFKKELLPEGYNFVFMDEKAEKRVKEISGNFQDIWEHDLERKLVRLPRVWEEGAKDVLAFLHEISHSFVENLEERNQEIAYCENIIRTIKEDGARVKHTEELKRMVKKYLNLVSQKERYAWARALSVCREIAKEKGIDLLKPFKGKTPLKTRKNLEEYIHGSMGLGCTESDVANSLVAEELKGIFTTKIYKDEKFTLEHRRKIRR